MPENETNDAARHALNGAAGGKSTSPDDTADYLDALEYGRSTKAWNSDGKPAMETSEYYDISRYHASERRRKRKSVLRAIALVLAAVLVVGSVGVGVFVANINTRLTENVTDDLRDQLAPTREPGEPFYMLLLGIDKDQGRIEDVENYGAEDSAYRSDSIMLCRIDPKKVKVTMVSIHRDTLVDLDEYGDQKINAAYSFGGAAYATEVVSTFADVPISHYAEVDLDRFIAIVDVVGGVTVDLPVPVRDPEYTGLNLPAGKQVLNGTQAALLCRCRHGYDNYGDGDRFRAANQRMVFSEVIKKVLASDPATMATTISAMADSVTTDLDLGKILELASQMLSLDVETDIMTGMEPTDGIMINDTWYEVCLVDKWKKMMMRVNQGLPPYDENEYDVTAGIAGGVGEEGERAAASAEAGDRNEALSKESSQGSGSASSSADSAKDDGGEETQVDNNAGGNAVNYTTDGGGGYDPGYVNYDPGYVPYDPGYVPYDPGYYDPGYVDYGGEW